MRSLAPWTRGDTWVQQLARKIELIRSHPLRLVVGTALLFVPVVGDAAGGAIDTAVAGDLGLDLGGASSAVNTIRAAAGYGLVVSYNRIVRGTGRCCFMLQCWNRHIVSRKPGAGASRTPSGNRECTFRPGQVRLTTPDSSKMMTFWGPLRGSVAAKRLVIYVWATNLMKPWTILTFVVLAIAAKQRSTITGAASHCGCCDWSPRTGRDAF